MDPGDIDSLDCELHPTKVRILNAAEELFATRGYHAVSIRDITLTAGVEVALANYHFGLKEDLFRHVVMRRLEAHCSGVLAELDRAQAAADGIASVEQIVRAFCSFTFRKCMHGGPGWARYFQLLARTAQLPVYEPAMAPLNKSYGVIVRRYTAALAAALPTIQPGNLTTGFYLLQSIVARLLAETELLERQSHGLCKALDFDAHLERIVPFVAAGFYALAGKPELGMPTHQPAAVGRESLPSATQA